MFLRRQIRTIPAGNPAPDGTQVELRLHVDNSLVATAETQGGWVEFQIVGGIGPHYISATINNETHIASSKGTGISGATDIANLPLFMRVYSDGYIIGVLGHLDVTGPGAGMQVSVNSGAAYIKGVLYDQHIPQTLPIEAPQTQKRIDLVVVEIVPFGGGDNIEGRSRLKVKKGTPAAVPVAPSLTQTTTLWEYPLAEVTVDPGVSSIAANKVVSKRVPAAPFIPNNSITNGKLTSGDERSDAAIAVFLKADTDSPTPVWGAMTLKELIDVTQATPTDGQVLTYDSALTGWRPETLPAATTTTTGGGIFDVTFDDANFVATGNLSGGWRTLGTATITLPPGKWLIESQTNLTARGYDSGSGTFTTRLDGNGTPQGADVSSRIFQTVQGVPRQVILSGRRIVTTTSSQTAAQRTFTARAQVTHQGGATSDIRDGVVFLRAYGG